MNLGISMGEDCIVSPTARFIGCVVLGDRVSISDGVVIGSPGEHVSRGTTEDSVIHIGDDTVIREHVVIQRGLAGDDPRGWGTNIGKRCYIMHGVHIAHDCVLGNEVTVAPGVVMAGHVAVLDGATIGIGVSIHQRVTIGGESMVGMDSTLLHDVPTRTLVRGSPARAVGPNIRGIEKSWRNPLLVAQLEAEYDRLKGARPEIKWAV